MWKLHKRNPLGTATLRKGLPHLLPSVNADSLSPFSVAEFIVTAMNAKSGSLFAAVKCFDYLDWMPAEKIYTIKANISLLAKSLYPKKVLWRWPLSKDYSSKRLKDNFNVVTLWPTASISGTFWFVIDLPNSQFSSLLHKSKNACSMITSYLISLREGHYRNS